MVSLTNNTLLLLSRDDLLEDFALISYLLSDTKQLFSLLPRTEKQMDILKVLNQQLRTYEHKTDKILSLLAHQLSESSHDIFVSEKHNLMAGLRSLRYLIAAVIQQHEWQSPAFYSTTIDQTGKYSGFVQLYQTDYKRDRHLDAEYWEKRFCETYFPNKNIKAYLTSSGMAAVTTAYTYIARSQSKRLILMGKNSYHENKELACMFFGKKNILWVDESDTPSVISLLKTKKPNILLLDSLTNSCQLIKPAITAFIGVLKKFPYKSTIVIDNTCLSLYGDFISNQPQNVNVVQIESLAKYHQYGLDKVTGGIILGNNGKIAPISNIREHIGTNITDLSPYVIPLPDKNHMKLKLKRHERNAYLFSTWLRNHLADHAHYLSTVSFPDTASQMDKRAKFSGSCVVVDFKESWKSLESYKRFHDTLFSKAHSAKFHLVSGTSFGFTISRIYLVASHSEYAKPFVRIAFGTESRLEMERFTQIFEETMHASTSI